MNTKVTIPIFIRTFFLFPIFMIFVLIPIMILIIIASFLPYGKLIATKLYDVFGWVGLKFVGIKLIVIRLNLKIIFFKNKLLIYKKKIKNLLLSI